MSDFYQPQLYLSVDLDFYYHVELQNVIKLLTKYIRRHDSLWNYPYYGVYPGELSTASSTILNTKDEIRIALHILKYYNNRFKRVTYIQICSYIQILVNSACNVFTSIFVRDDLVDHLAVSILLSYTEITRITACRCLEQMRGVYNKYPTEKSFPYSTLYMEAHLVDMTKISELNYETLRKAIHPKCKNFHVNLLLSAIVHISHNVERLHVIPDILTESSLNQFFDCVHYQFMFALIDCNQNYHIHEEKDDIEIISVGPVGSSEFSSKLWNSIFQTGLITPITKDDLSKDELVTSLTEDKTDIEFTEDDLYKSETDIELSKQASLSLSDSNLNSEGMELELKEYNNIFDIPMEEIDYSKSFDFSLDKLLSKISAN